MSTTCLFIHLFKQGRQTHKQDFLHNYRIRPSSDVMLPPLLSTLFWPFHKVTQTRYTEHKQDCKHNDKIKNVLLNTVCLCYAIFTVLHKKVILSTPGFFYTFTQTRYTVQKTINRIFTHNYRMIMCSSIKYVCCYAILRI